MLGPRAGGGGGDSGSEEQSDGEPEDRAGSSDSGGEGGDAEFDMLESSDDEEDVPRAGAGGSAPRGVKRSVQALPEPSHAGMAVKRPRVQSRAEAAAAVELDGLSVAEQEALALRVLTRRER